MLATLHGTPIIDHVLAVAAAAVGKDNICLLTSTDPSDDVLARHAEERGFTVFRGSLDNVIVRFQEAARAYPSDWFFRICGDSPLLDAGLLCYVREIVEGGAAADIVTNVHPRTFPKGQSVELLRTARFLELETAMLSDAEREHVTLAYYNSPELFSVRNISLEPPQDATDGYTVDTPEDLDRLELLTTVPAFADQISQPTACRDD